MNQKKEYVSPKADVMLLAPCEALAAVDCGFGAAWRDTWGRFTDPGGASGIAFGGTFEPNDVTQDGGFIIKNRTN